MSFVTKGLKMLWKWRHTFGIVAFIVLIGALLAVSTQLKLTHDHGKANHFGFWSMVIIGLLLIGLMVVIGYGIVDRFDGLLVDSRNRVTLATFQLVIWTVVVLASYGAALTTNLLAGKSAIDALDVSIPPELWVALGISGTAFLGTNVVRSNQGQDLTRDAGTLGAAGMTEADAHEKGVTRRGRLAVRRNSDKATWGDLFVSDYASDAMRVDISKVQMFFFTIVLAFGYAAASADLLINATAPIDKLPDLNNGFVTLLGLSSGGYLLRKAGEGLGT